MPWITGSSRPRSARRWGRAPDGTVRLGAYQDGDHICIEVSDDGRGLDRDAILSKALEKGLLSREEAPRAGTERILGFIFLPGFSTAERVSDISGRGVGMDAVKARRGRNEREPARALHAPCAAPRSRSRSLSPWPSLPRCWWRWIGSTYAIPLSSVREILKIHADALKSVGGRRVILLREEVLALVHLGSALRDGKGGEPQAPSEGMPVVVVDFEGRKIGLEVEKITGDPGGRHQEPEQALPRGGWPDRRLHPGQREDRAHRGRGDTGQAALPHRQGERARQRRGERRYRGFCRSGGGARAGTRPCADGRSCRFGGSHRAGGGVRGPGGCACR